MHRIRPLSNPSTAKQLQMRPSYSAIFNTISLIGHLNTFRKLGTSYILKVHFISDTPSIMHWACVNIIRSWFWRALCWARQSTRLDWRSQANRRSFSQGLIRSVCSHISRLLCYTYLHSPVKGHTLKHSSGVYVLLCGFYYFPWDGFAKKHYSTEGHAACSDRLISAISIHSFHCRNAQIDHRGTTCLLSGIAPSLPFLSTLPHPFLQLAHQL